MTPEQVHYGLAQKVYEDRCQVLLEAYERPPQRCATRVGPRELYKIIKFSSKLPV